MLSYLGLEPPVLQPGLLLDAHVGLVLSAIARCFLLESGCVDVFILLGSHPVYLTFTLYNFPDNRGYNNDRRL